MFNWLLFITIALICLPGNWIMSKKTIPGIKEKLSSQDSVPSDTILFAMLFSQNFILSIVAAAVGTALAPKIGVKDPLTVGLFSGESWSWNAFSNQIVVGVIAGIFCAGLWLLFNYGYYRRKDERINVIVSEKVRRQIGLTSRVLSGGIGEEVMFRWGLLSLFLWLGTLLVGEVTTGVLWVSIIITGVLFGWAHIPGYVGAGCKKTPLLVFTAIVGNLWVAIVCGLLFWNYGLLAAIIVHMLFHILWYPFERYTHLKESRDEIEREIQTIEPRKELKQVSFPKFRDMLQTEKNIYLYAFLPKKMKKGKEEDEHTFTYHVKSGYLAIVIMLIHALVLEAFAIHLLVRIWSELAAWLLTASSVYFIIFLLADYNAVRLSPLKIKGDRIIVQTGFRNAIDLDVHNISSVELFKRDESFQKRSNKEKEQYRAINAVLLEMNQDTPLIKVEMKTPSTMTGYYGVKKQVSMLYLTADEPTTLYHLLKTKVEERVDMEIEGTHQIKKEFTDVSSNTLKSIKNNIHI